MANSLWSDFKDGKAYLRVERKDWDAFIGKCERDGLRSRSGRRASEFNPLRGGSHIFISHNLWGDGTGLGWGQPDDPYHNTCGLPIHEFKSVLGDSAKEGDSGMAHTFKVGDIVRGIGNTYPITNKSMTRGQVVDIDDSGIWIRVLMQTDGLGIGKRFLVSQVDEFELIKPAHPISRVTYSPPATVVFWSDGTKTVAKCAPHERYDREKGLAIACAKKLLGAGYADAFKEFREPVNRVLTRNEVCALKIGDAVWVEDISGLYKSDLHVAKWELICGKVLVDADDKHYHIGAPGKRFGATWRVWLLPRKPTAAELAANPWKLEGN